MISVIIVNFNGEKRLNKCIESLLSQTYKNFEIIIIDNGSSDNSIKILEKYGDKIKVIKSNKNGGFAYGNNLGINNANGEYILFLNNDTWINCDFLEKYINSFKKSGFSILGVAEKDYHSNNVKSATYRIDLFGHPVFDKQNYNIGYKNVFYAQGSCLLLRKEIYIKTGMMDEDFFMYCEEVDWQRRCLLYGYKIGIDTNIYINHAGGGSTGGGIKYNVFLRRNQNTLQMLLKNYYIFNLLWIIPIYIFINIGEIIGLSLFGNFKIAYTYILGWAYNIRIFHKTLQKRNYIQENRKIYDRDINNKMLNSLSKLKHLYKFIKEKLGKN